MISLQLKSCNQYFPGISSGSRAWTNSPNRILRGGDPNSNIFNDHVTLLTYTSILLLRAWYHLLQFSASVTPLRLTSAALRCFMTSLADVSQRVSEQNCTWTRLPIPHETWIKSPPEAGFRCPTWPREAIRPSSLYTVLHRAV